MMLIPLLSTLILSANAATRYALGEYLLVTDTAIVPFPIDICVNNKVELSGATYAKYTCNKAGDVVTFTDYGADSTCRTIVSTEEITDTTLFNCDGEDNYVVGQACTASKAEKQPTLGAAGNETCCQGPQTGFDPGCLYTTFATGVCYEGTAADDGTVAYVENICDDMGVTGFVYTDDACTTPVGTSDELTSGIDDCSYITTQLIFDVYNRMRTCVANGTQISEDTYCDQYGISFDPTPSPTPSPVLPPTPMTDEPTSPPTPMPTEDTDAPTEAPTAEPTEAGKAGSHCVAGLLFMVMMNIAILI